MKPSNVSKLAALVCSMALAGGFVAYSAGAFGRLTSDRQQPEQPKRITAESPAMFAGSKSAVLTDQIDPPTGDPFGPPAPAKVEPPAAFFGGSKTISIAPLVPPPAQEAAPPSANASAASVSD